MAGTVPYSAIKSFLANYFSAVYPVVDFDEIDRELEQSEEPFLAIEEIVSDEEHVGFGNPDSICVRESGSLAIHCFSPAPHASEATRSIADSVRDSLRMRNIDGVRIRDVGAPDPGEMMNQGIWSAASLLLLYEWDTHFARPD